MSIKCDKCNSENVSSKQITGKRDGKQYTVYECQNGCMNPNGKWKYSFFPPKESRGVTREEFDALERRVAVIETFMSRKNDTFITNDELEADDKLPF